MAECICYLLPPEMHTTHYGATEPGSMHEPNPNCTAHREDQAVGVTERIAKRDYMVGRIEVWKDELDYARGVPCWTVMFDLGLDVTTAPYDPYHYRNFPAHAEAIAYADRIARGES